MTDAARKLLNHVLTPEQLAKYELRATMAERERCAEIADPWPGFPTTEPNAYDLKLTSTDKAVIEVRQKIAGAIRNATTIPGQGMTMTKYPRLNSAGLRGARQIAREQGCSHEWSEWEVIGYTGDWFKPHIVARKCKKCTATESDDR